MEEGPGPSCDSIKSDHSKGHPIDFKNKRSSSDFVPKTPPTGPSCESIRSDHSKDPPLDFNNEPSVEPRQTEHHDSGLEQSTQTELDAIFKRLEETLVTFVKDELKRFHKVLCSNDPECFDKEEEEEEDQNNREAFLKITLDFLRRMNQESLAERLHSKSPSGVCQSKLKSLLKQRFRCVSEGISKEGKQTLLNQIYTELYITEGGASEVNQEHEVRHIQSASRKRSTSEATILCKDLFKGPAPKLGPIREEPTMGQEQIRAKEISRQSPPVTKQVIKKQRLIKNMFKKITSGLWSVKTGKSKKREPNGTKEQPIRAEQTKEPIRAEQTEEPIRAEQTEQPIRAEQSGEPIRAEQTEEPIRAEQTEEPIRAEQTEEPIRAEQTEEPIRAEQTEEPIRAEQTGRRGPVRTVLTKGVAGIGKTMMTQKFSLDWAEGKANQDIQLLFPFTFRELNVLRDRQFSLMELLHHFFSEAKGLGSLEHLKVLFILDGLDECRLPLDFSRTRALTEPTESASVEELLVNLIRGNLLPSAHLWITTRPAAANQIPVWCISMVTEVQGFTDPQKEEYFRKRFRDEQQATAVISHIKKSLSLFIMCHMPVFCWILSTVLEHVLKEKEGEELPHTFTQMYIHFLVVQAKVKGLKYDGRSATDSPWSPETREMVQALGKLAFEQLLKGNLIFYESDLSECGLDAAEIARYSGVFTQVFREEPGLYQDKVYCFIHLSVQEFLAALHVHQTFFSSGVNLLSTQQTSESPEDEFVAFYRSAVDRALESPNGHLDLFLRFLLGLSLPTNQSLLPVLLTQTESSPEVNQKTIEYIKERIGEGLSTEGSINLFHCLNELNDHTLVEQIQENISEGRLSDMTPALWSALVFILLSSDVELEVFDLRKYSVSTEAFLNLLPVIKVSKTAILSDCFLSERSCGQLASVLGSEFSSLRNLDLSNNDLRVSGVEVLCSGLMSVNCRLETLSLRRCLLFQTGCGPLSSVLESSSLRLLDLTLNVLKDSGVEQLCSALKSSTCRLETLKLVRCLLSQSCCGPLASVLCSESSSLRNLDLSYNNLLDSGVELLCEGLKSAPCRLETLRLRSCLLSEKCCGPLSTVLSSTSLTLLDLSVNDLRDSGVELLCSGLKSATCRLQTLSLSGCVVFETGGAALVSALSFPSSNLRELDMSYNHPGPSAELLSALQNQPHFCLDSLRMKPSGAKYFASGLKKYFCDLVLDVNTAHRALHLSEDLRTVSHVEEEQPYPVHQDRFDCRPQVLTSTALGRQCLWEVQWDGCGEDDPGWVDIAVCYKKLKRKGDGKECQFGHNDESWILRVFKGQYSIRHRGKEYRLRSSASQQVSVYLDMDAGLLLFYELSSDGKWRAIASFCTTFTETLVAGFACYCSSVRFI